MKKALLIGIDEYSNPALNLSGCVSDVEGIESQLHKRGYGTMRLTNKSAHKFGIQYAIQNFLKMSKDEDELIVFYAGHGSQVKDESGDEKDSMDETICPSDHPNMLKDDELYELFIKKPKGAKLTVIFDCCHSGTAYREVSDKEKDRFVKPKETGKKIRTIKERTFDIPNSIFISACSDDETAKEINVDGVVRGAFSYALEQVLNGGADMSDYASIVYEVTKFMEEKGINQTPEVHVSATIEESVDSTLEDPENIKYPTSEEQTQNALNESSAVRPQLDKIESCQCAGKNIDVEVYHYFHGGNYDVKHEVQKNKESKAMEKQIKVQIDSLENSIKAIKSLYEGKGMRVEASKCCSNSRASFPKNNGPDGKITVAADRSDCYVEVRVYAGSSLMHTYNIQGIYGTYHASSSDSSQIYNSATDFEATSYCSVPWDIEFETIGAGTALMTGRVKDQYGNGISGVTMIWNHGGACVTQSGGYYSTVVLPMEGVICAWKPGKRVAFKHALLTTSETVNNNFTLYNM